MANIPIIYQVLYIPAGAGFCPSTVSTGFRNAGISGCHVATSQLHSSTHLYVGASRGVAFDTTTSTNHVGRPQTIFQKNPWRKTLHLPTRSADFFPRSWELKDDGT